MKLEKCLVLYGSGKNGKSVFVDIVEALLGKENISHESLSDMCGENGDRSRANLSGKLLNTCSDVAPNAFSGDIFKRIASGEPISTRQLYKDISGDFRLFPLKFRYPSRKWIRNWPRRLFLQSYPEL